LISPAFPPLRNLAKICGGRFEEALGRFDSSGPDRRDFVAGGDIAPGEGVLQRGFARWRGIVQLRDS
jgi:hypothetical protein